MMERNTRRTFLATTLAAIVAFAFVGTVRAADDDHMNMADKAMLKDALRNLKQVEQTGEVARNKTESTGVKHYVANSVEAANDMIVAMQKIAESSKVKFDEDPTKGDVKDKKGLQKMKGHDFDVEYMDQQIDTQKELLDLFKKGADDAKNDDLKHFFKSHTDDLERRVDAAKKLYKELKEKDTK